MVSKEVGFDGGKLLKGRKRFLTVDTLGLVVRVLVTAASVGEREGGKRVLKRVSQMGQAMMLKKSQPIKIGAPELMHQKKSATILHTK